VRWWTQLTGKVNDWQLQLQQQQELMMMQVEHNSCQHDTCTV
jgi:hypothetical protein